MYKRQILNQFSELVDEGFVQVCEQVAAKLQDAGQDDEAGFLRNVAEQVGAFLASQATEGNQPAALHQFWQQLLQAEMESGGDAAAVHQVMRPHMELIVPALGDVIAQSMERVLAQYPEGAEDFADLVGDTCTSIQQFPYDRQGKRIKLRRNGT